MAVLCTDDANVRSLMPLITKPVTTYGLNESAQIRATHIRHEAGRIPVIGWTLAGASLEEGVGGWNRMESFELNLGFKKRNNVV